MHARRTSIAYPTNQRRHYSHRLPGADTNLHLRPTLTPIIPQTLCTTIYGTTDRNAQSRTGLYPYTRKASCTARCLPRTNLRSVLPLRGRLEKHARDEPADRLVGSDEGRTNCSWLGLWTHTISYPSHMARPTLNALKCGYEHKLYIHRRLTFTQCSSGLCRWIPADRGAVLLPIPVY